MNINDNTAIIIHVLFVTMWQLEASKRDSSAILVTELSRKTGCHEPIQWLVTYLCGCKGTIQRPRHITYRIYKRMPYVYFPSKCCTKSTHPQPPPWHRSKIIRFTVKIDERLSHVFTLRSSSKPCSTISEDCTYIYNKIEFTYVLI